MKASDRRTGEASEPGEMKASDRRTGEASEPGNMKASGRRTAQASERLARGVTAVLVLLAGCRPPEVVPGLDGERPRPPVLTLRPSASATPRFVVRGEAQAGTTVRLFPNFECAGVALAVAPAEALVEGVPLDAVPHSLNPVTGQAVSPAGLTSECSAAVQFTHLSGFPQSLGLVTVPSTYGAEPRPILKARVLPALAGQLVRLYEGDGCQGAPFAELTREQAQVGVPVSARRNQHTEWSGRVENADGDASSCAGVGYLHDDLPPEAPWLASAEPSSPSSESAVTLNIGSLENCVDVFTSRGCQGSPLPFSCPVQSHQYVLVTVTPDAVTDFSAWATDAAGNRSECVELLAHRHDSMAPPARPQVYAVHNGVPRGSFTVWAVGGAGGDSRVTLFANATCSGTPLAALLLSGYSIDVTLELTSSPWASFSAEAWLNGHPSDCASTRVFVDHP
jgi:hypothetical protein